MSYTPPPAAQPTLTEIEQVCAQGAALPQHVAVIMDGNGRWAQERGAVRTEGHRAGIDSVRSVTRACRWLGIPYLTLYSFSTENWKRPRTEVAFLMRLLARFLKEEIPELVENEIRLAAIGQVDRLPGYARRRLEKAKTSTAGGKRMQLTLALSYGSREELTTAVQGIAGKVQSGELQPEAITSELVSEHLYTAAMPDPDLLIRTSGEMRLSNFMLWQLSYAELVVVPDLWPDFRDLNFYESVRVFLGRNRRYGLVKSQS